MRLLFILLMVLGLGMPPVLCADDAGFDAFIKSREVVATIFFRANSEELAKEDLERIAATVNQLRDLQKKGRMIRVEGFSSPEGDQEVNFQLSFFRARTVADLIEEKGLPAEVTLTGYGDLRATSNDPNKERRVEIASYAKPVVMKRIKIVKKMEKMAPTAYPDVTQAADSEEQTIDSFTVDRAIRQKIADKQQRLADKQKFAENEVAPGFTQALPPEELIIDALTIEQAIMEKIGAVSLPPSGEVSQVDTVY